MTDSKRPQEAVVIERSFDAPADLIWQMWTDPEHVKEWFGPTGATIPVARMDVRVGGRRLVCMEVETPAGRKSMWLAGEYLQVVTNQLLVYTEFISDENGDAVPRRRWVWETGIPPQPRSEWNSKSRLASRGWS